jgi:hypothetical protein
VRVKVAGMDELRHSEDYSCLTLDSHCFVEI